MAEGIEVSPKRRLGSTRPPRSSAAALSCHLLILRLWDEGAIDNCLRCGQLVQRQRTLKEVATLVGRDPSTVWWHINGKCRCGL